MGKEGERGGGGYCNPSSNAVRWLASFAADPTGEVNWSSTTDDDRLLEPDRLDTGDDASDGGDCGECCLQATAPALPLPPLIIAQYGCR
jgi:hypothetical protein